MLNSSVDAVVEQCLYVSAMLHNADDAAVLLVSIFSICDLHAMLCRSHCTAVGLAAVEQQCDAVVDQCLYVSAMLHNADDAAVLLVSIFSICDLHSRSHCTAVGLDAVE